MPARRQFPTRPLAAAAAVVVENGRVLLIERGRPPLEGFWSVPGGVIELGESARAAAAREVREETGLEVGIGPLLALVDRIERAPDGRVRFHYLIADFLATLRPGAPRSLAPDDDARRARWFSWDEAFALRLTPGLEPVLARARRRLDQKRL